MAERSAFPHTAAAMREATALVWLTWVSAVPGAQLSPREQQLYLQGLASPQSVLYPYQGDPFSALIQNLAPAAPRLEYGFPAYHLPDVIRWGQTPGTRRRSKRGLWYMIVPFTHSTPGTQHNPMPAPVYRQARRLQPGQRLTAGPTSGRALHAGGMQPYVPAYARNVRPGYEHAARQEGMIRRPGRGRGSQYLTFRTMTQSSAGWWIPPKQGVHLAKQVERETAPQVQQLIADGLAQDVAALLQRQVGGR